MSLSSLRWETRRRHRPTDLTAPTFMARTCPPARDRILDTSGEQLEKGRLYSTARDIPYVLEKCLQRTAQEGEGTHLVSQPLRPRARRTGCLYVLTLRPLLRKQEPQMIRQSTKTRLTKS